MAETNVPDSAPFPPEVMDFIESMGTNDVSDEQMAEMFKLILQDSLDPNVLSTNDLNDFAQFGLKMVREISDLEQSDPEGLSERYMERINNFHSNWEESKRQSNEKAAERIPDLMKFASAWFHLIDHGKYDAVYALFLPNMKKDSSAEKWQSSIKAI